MKKSELINHYWNLGILKENEIQRLFYHIFGIKPHPNYQISLKYLIHSLKHPEIYKTRFNK